MTASDSSARSAPSSANAGPPRAVGAGSRIPNNLLALGSAAVMSVYAVGYLRTKAAADRFDEKFGDEHDSRRRPAELTDAARSNDAQPHRADQNRTPGLAQRGISDSAAMQTADGRSVRVVAQDAPAARDAHLSAVTPRARASVGSPTATASDQPQRAAASTASSANSVSTNAVSTNAARANAVSTTTPSSNVSTSSTDVAPAQAPSASMYSTGNTAAPRAASSVASSSTPVTPASDSAKPPVPTVAAATAEVMPKMTLHDGTYTGYGTSRHGDIEATVIVENGRIKTAAISRCLTRYSCSWIAHLRGQVVARQSPEVDYVSGATESTNAFYYAVLEALTKAQ